MNYLAVKWDSSNNDIYTKHSAQFFGTKCDLILCRNYVEICKSLSNENMQSYGWTQLPQ